MNKIIVLPILLICGILIASADSFIKKSALSGSFANSFKSPWLYLSVLFYLIQILLVLYLFLSGWKLGIVANIFNVFYAIFAVGLGYLIFAEKLALLQVVGIILGLAGVVLMTR